MYVPVTDGGEVHDKGSAVKGDHIDIFFPSEKEASPGPEIPGCHNYQKIKKTLVNQKKIKLLYTRSYFLITLHKRR